MGGIRLTSVLAVGVATLVVGATTVAAAGDVSNSRMSGSAPMAVPETAEPVALTVGAGWVLFDFGGAGSALSFTYTSAKSVVIKVTDDFCKGDEFALAIDGAPIGATTPVETGDCNGWDNGDLAFADPAYSSGTFSGPKGTHTIDLAVVESPVNFGAAWIRVDRAKTQAGSSCAHSGRSNDPNEPGAGVQPFGQIVQEVVRAPDATGASAFVPVIRAEGPGTTCRASAR